jgi:hypothetical protein
MTDMDVAEKHRELLARFQRKDVIPHAEIPEQVWSDLEARGVIERTLGGYLRLTRYGRQLLAL